MKIQILDKILVNQIAAGEVVERPASVVKELVENCVDAGATEITVIISAGGQSKIEVIDNGEGMTKEDALLAIERFGTSKIKTIDDFDNISTNGFRGEALPSITSISKVKISTQTKDEKIGTVLEVIGGKTVDIIEKPLTQGTRIEVEQLFFNVPARRKFLRSEKTEQTAIKSLLEGLALAYPNLKIRLVADGKEIFNVTGIMETENAFAKRVRQLGFKEKEFFLLDTSSIPKQNFINIEGCISEPIAAAANSTKLYIIVNGRIIRDKVIFKAVKDGYGQMMKPNRYPEGVLKITISPQDIDVNVHPQKTEVRFRTPELIYSSIYRLVSKTLNAKLPEYASQSNNSLQVTSNAENIKTFDPKPNPQFPDAGVHNTGPLQDNSIAMFSAYQTQNNNKATFIFDNNFQAESSTEIEPTQFPRKTSLAEIYNTGQTIAKPSTYHQMRYVGQVLGCFILLESENELVILDMHAAHERATFYKLKTEFEKGNALVQDLLIPEMIELSADEAENYNSAHDILNRIGFKINLIENDNNGCFLEILSNPVTLQKFSTVEILRDLLNLPTATEWHNELDKHIDEVLSRIACHSSVRSGQVLREEEVYALLELVDTVECSAFCPHGRPIAKVFNRAELEKLFGRIQ